MASSDVDASEYDLGTTSVRLVIFYDDTAIRFKRAEREFRGK